MASLTVDALDHLAVRHARGGRIAKNLGDGLCRRAARTPNLERKTGRDVVHHADSGVGNVLEGLIAPPREPMSTRNTTPVQGMADGGAGADRRCPSAGRRHVDRPYTCMPSIRFAASAMPSSPLSSRGQDDAERSKGLRREIPMRRTASEASREVIERDSSAPSTSAAT